MTDPTRSIPGTNATHSANPVTHSAAGNESSTTPGHSAVTSSDPPAFAPQGYDLLGEPVGQGGMGVVYRARDRELNREVAVKILLPKFGIGSTTALRFVEEAQITSQLQHPGIPPVYRVGALADGRPFLAMKLIKGQTLDVLLKERGPGSTNWLGVFEGICQAVGYAHAHHVVHRDLKPGNVMVGSFGEVQVMDWGLVKVLGERRDVSPPVGADPDATDTEIQSLRADAQISQEGMAMGTPAYMPPEQAVGDRDRIDQRTDVFALGGILCALLTGKPPYVGVDAKSTLQLAMQAKLGDCFARLDGCGADPDLVSLCKRCLSAEQDDRPADGQAVAKAIADLRAAADERARRAEIDRAKAEVETREQRKRRRVWRIAAAVLLAGVVGTTIGLIQARDAKQRESERADGEAKAKDRETEQRGIAEVKRAEAVKAAEAEKAAKQKAVEFRDRALNALRAATSEDVEKLLGEKKELTANERAYLEAIAKRWQVFAKQEGDDEQTRAIQAEGHDRVAHLWAKLGRSVEAKPEYERAIAILERLATEFPTVPRYQYVLAHDHGNLGLLLINLGEVAEADREYRTGLTIIEKLVTAYPEASEYQNELADIHSALGHLLTVNGRLAEGEKYLRSGLERLAKLTAEFPTAVGYRSSLAFTHNGLGELLAHQGKLEGAVGEHRAALAIQESLAAQFPDAAAYRGHVARTRMILGDTLGKMRRWEEAEEEYRQALLLHEKLCAEFPAFTGYRHFLAGNHSNLGLTLANQGRATEAERQYRAGLKIQAKLAADFPSDVFAHRDLAITHTNLGNLLAGQGKRAEADEQYSKALTLREKLAREFPAVPDHMITLGGSYCDFGNWVQETGKLADSLIWFQKAIDTLRPVHEKEVRDGTVKRYLRNSYWSRAKVYGWLDRHADAAADWEKVVELNPESERAWAHFQHGIALDRAGAVKESAAAFDRGLTLREQAVTAAGQDAREPRWLLALYLLDRGRVDLTAGRNEPAAEWMSRAVAGFESFARKWPGREVNHQLRWSHQNRAEALDRLGRHAEAVRDWDRVIELSPKEEQPRARASRATSQVNAGQVAEAVTEVAELRKLSGWNAGQWYGFACVYAVASSKIAEEKRNYADRVMEMLRKAVKAGYKDTAHMKRDKDLDPLRDREDFKTLLAELEKKHPPKREVLPPPRKE